MSWYQETYNRVRDHLLAQGQRSEIAHEFEPGRFECLYRGPGGTMCAIGCLIPDEMYRHLMEGNSAYDLFQRFPELGTLLGDPSDSSDNSYSSERTERIEFLGKLQAIHDNKQIDEGSSRECIIKTWTRKLTDLAQLYGLRP